MRTEANKMHKSIPLRKQETHSASLMTDLGLNSFLFPDTPFRMSRPGYDWKKLPSWENRAGAGSLWHCPIRFFCRKSGATCRCSYEGGRHGRGQVVVG